MLSHEKALLVIAVMSLISILLWTVPTEWVVSKRLQPNQSEKPLDISHAWAILDSKDEETIKDCTKAPAFVELRGGQIFFWQNGEEAVAQLEYQGIIQTKQQFYLQYRGIGSKSFWLQASFMRHEGDILTVHDMIGFKASERNQRPVVMELLSVKGNNIYLDTWIVPCPGL